MLDLMKTIAQFTSFGLALCAATIFIVAFFKKKSKDIKARKDLKAKEAKIKEELYKVYLKNEQEKHK